MDRTGLPITDNDAVRKATAKLDHSARLARWFGTGLLAIGTTAMLLAAAATVYVGVQVRTLVQGAVEEQQRVALEDEEEQKLIGTIMACILGQFAEHRTASREFFERSLAERGVPPLATSPPDLSYDPAKVLTACDETTRLLAEDGGGISD